MRTFEVKITVQIPIEELPLDKVVDDEFIGTVFNKAMHKIDGRRLRGFDIVEKRVGQPDLMIF